MTARYDVAFYARFKHGLERLPQELYPIVDRHIGAISADPFGKHVQAKRLVNAVQTYSARVGIHARMLYRLNQRLKRLEIIAVAHRAEVYEAMEGGRPLLPSEVEQVYALLRGQKAAAPAPGSRPAAVPAADESPLVVEVLEWISADELFLLQIPGEHWAGILEAGSVEGLKALELDARYKTLIEDYWTNPEASQVEKLYALGDGQDAMTIARRPLSQFLVALDPEQREALQRIKADGPYLLKGSAGTGKSLVGLYHLRDMIMARAGETLFDTDRPGFGVITYTNTLVDANDLLLKSITAAEAHPSIRCSTLDRVARSLAARFLNKDPASLSAINSEGTANYLERYIVPNLPADAAELLSRLGFDFVAEEIEQVIQGNGLETQAEYLALERRGRKRGLREAERRVVWGAYEDFSRLCIARNVQTFEQWRLMALRFLQQGGAHEKYTVLFVDEAQDFSKVARQLCLALIHDPRHLLLAADTAQSIYAVPASWRQVDPRFDFRRRRPIALECSYRATREIAMAIAPLRADPGDEEERSRDARPMFSGPRPHWVDKPLEQHAGYAAAAIHALIGNQKGGINPGQIAIIVRDAPRGERYLNALKEKDVPASLIAKGKPLRLQSGQVHIITAHSSKGLGFPIVFVPEVSAAHYPWNYVMSKARDAQHKAQLEEREQRLLYVALSRASHRLFMIADVNAPSPFLARLDRAAHWK